MSASQILTQEPVELPLLPLRDVVVFPHMVIPLFVGRPRSIKALELAMEAGSSVMLVAQKSAGKDEPTPDDLYEIGCAANILQMLKLPDGTVKVLVEGQQRATGSQGGEPQLPGQAEHDEAHQTAHGHEASERHMTVRIFLGGEGGVVHRKWDDSAHDCPASP